MLFPYLIITEIWPRRHEYVQQEQVFYFVIGMFGNVVICIMSLHWLVLLTKNGPRPLLFFEKKAGTGDLIMGRKAPGKKE